MSYGRDETVDSILGHLTRLHMFVPCFERPDNSQFVDAVWEFAYLKPHPDELREAVSREVEYLQNSSDGAPDGYGISDESILTAVLSGWIDKKWTAYVKSCDWSPTYRDADDDRRKASDALVDDRVRFAPMLLTMFCGVVGHGRFRVGSSGNQCDEVAVVRFNGTETINNGH